MGKFCSNCGVQVNENEKFCHSCGAELKKEPKESNGITNMEYNSQPNTKSGQNFFSEEYLKETFLSRNGRLGRFSYFKLQIVLTVAIILLDFIVEAFLLKEWETTNTLCKIIELIISLSALYPTYCLTVRRLKDMNKSLSLANWYIFVEGIYTVGVNLDDRFGYSTDGKGLGLIFLIFTLYLIFTPGTSGANQYGEDPNKV